MTSGFKHCVCLQELGNFDPPQAALVEPVSGAPAGRAAVVEPAPEEAAVSYAPLATAAFVVNQVS